MRNLIYICMAGMLLGLISLLALARSMQAVEMRIDSISEADIGKAAIIRGRVAGIYESNGNYFLNLCASKCVRVSVFSRTRERMLAASTDISKVKNGDFISAEGVLKKYKGAISLELLDYNSLQVERK